MGNFCLILPSPNRLNAACVPVWGKSLVEFRAGIPVCSGRAKQTQIHALGGRFEVWRFSPNRAVPCGELFTSAGVDRFKFILAERGATTSGPWRNKRDMAWSEGSRRKLHPLFFPFSSERLRGLTIEPRTTPMRIRFPFRGKRPMSSGSRAPSVSDMPTEMLQGILADPDRVAEHDAVNYELLARGVKGIEDIDHQDAEVQRCRPSGYSPSGSDNSGCWGCLILPAGVVIWLVYVLAYAPGHPADSQVLPVNCPIYMQTLLAFPRFPSPGWNGCLHRTWTSTYRVRTLNLCLSLIAEPL